MRNIDESQHSISEKISVRNIKCWLSQCFDVLPCDVQRVLQSIQNTSVKPQPAVAGAGRQPDENACANSAANYANRVPVSANSQNVGSSCVAGSTGCEMKPNEMFVFSFSYNF